jgi:hypothetical protein
MIVTTSHTICLRCGGICYKQCHQNKLNSAAVSIKQNEKETSIFQYEISVLLTGFRLSELIYNNI